jgi:hypothetical protein
MTANACSSEITSIVIYGSHARGDLDSESDLDICVFTLEKATVEVGQLTSLVEMPQHGHLSITTYCESDLTAMLEYGSLFLWHLKLEGRILYGNEYLASNLAKLKPFERHHSEIAYYSVIFSDLTAALSSPYTVNEFDLALLFTIARNTCMVLAHKAGLPTFGRSACYFAATRAFHDIPLDEATYLKLSHWKVVYERGININATLPSRDEMGHLLALIQYLLEYADAHTR